MSVRHIDSALVVNVEGDVRPLIGDYHALVVRGRGLVVDGQGGRTFDQWYTQVVGQLSQPYKYAGAGVLECGLLSDARMTSGPDYR
jgi:hypothetical protein